MLVALLSVWFELHFSFPFHFPFHQSNSGFYLYAPELLPRFLHEFPCPLVKPSQVFLQTSTKHMSLNRPLDLQWVSYCLRASIQTPGLPSGPTTVGPQLVSSIPFPPPYLTSLIYQDVLIRSTCHSHPASTHAILHVSKPSGLPWHCLESHQSLKFRSVRSPPGWSSSDHPSPPGFVCLWSSFFLFFFLLTIHVATPRCSALLAVLLWVYLLQLIHKLLQGVLAACAALLSRHLAHHLSQKCLFFYSLICRLFISLYQLSNVQANFS